MRMQYIHDGQSAEILLHTDTDAEARMLAALTPKEGALGVSMQIEYSGVYSGAPIKRIRLVIAPEPCQREGGEK